MIVKAFTNPWFDRPWPAPSLALHLAPLETFSHELDRLCSAQQSAVNSGRCAPGYAEATFELKDDGNQLLLTASLPGLKQSELELTATAEKLSLRGERRIEVPEGYSARRRERQSYTFSRSYSLPVKIDPDKVEAKLVDGILTVTLPKAEESKPRNITVHAT
jgi:HSP20 family protein